VIEGVMMRAADKWAVAVRSPNGEILIKKEAWHSIGRRFKVFEMPVLRGAVVLIETLVLGVKALSFSAEVASSEEFAPEKGFQNPADRISFEEKKGLWWSLSLAATVVFSLLLGIFAFFYLPLLLTEMLGIDNSFWFNVVDGTIRIAVFLAYLILISRWKEIKRVFEYHGAEHKTIAAYENKKELSWENIKDYSPFHARCGTSFVLVLMLVSILVFLMLGKPAGWQERFIRMLFIPLIGGVSYELIKLSDRFPNNPFTLLMIAPGLWLQRITTRPPDEKQVEVAAAALKAALDLDNNSVQEIKLAVSTWDG